MANETIRSICLLAEIMRLEKVEFDDINEVIQENMFFDGRVTFSSDFHILFNKIFGKHKQQQMSVYW